MNDMGTHHRRPPLSQFVPPLTKNQLEILLSFYDEGIDKSSPAESEAELEDILKLVDLGLLDTVARTKGDLYCINEDGVDRLLDPIGLARRRARKVGYSSRRSRPNTH